MSGLRAFTAFCQHSSSEQGSNIGCQWCDLFADILNQSCCRQGGKDLPTPFWFFFWKNTGIHISSISLTPSAISIRLLHVKWLSDTVLRAVIIGLMPKLVAISTPFVFLILNCGVTGSLVGGFFFLPPTFTSEISCQTLSSPLHSGAAIPKRCKLYPMGSGEEKWEAL